MFAVIFANGKLDNPPSLSPLLKQADLIVAADGGANHCAGLGITPDILLGDLDSIDAAILATYRRDGVTIHRHPRAKDATDLELALDLAVSRGARTIRLVAALGGRWDMSLANIMLAANEKYRGQEVYLSGENCIMRILHPGEPHTITAVPDQKVSFLPIKGDVHGVTLRGFVYPLTAHSILFGSSLGVSNIMAKSTATVQHREGILLCVLYDG
jgi:thiamine pyrophosphokinase